MANCVGYISFRVSVAWWLPLYVDGVRLMSWLTGLEPDMEKVERVVHHAISIRRV